MASLSNTLYRIQIGGVQFALNVNMFNFTLHSAYNEWPSPQTIHPSMILRVEMLLLVLKCCKICTKIVVSYHEKDSTLCYCYVHSCCYCCWLRRCQVAAVMCAMDFVERNTLAVSWYAYWIDRFRVELFDEKIKNKSM